MRTRLIFRRRSQQGVGATGTRKQKTESHHPHRPAPPPTVPRRLRPGAHRPRRPPALRHPAQGRAPQAGTPPRGQICDHHRRELPRIHTRTESADDRSLPPGPGRDLPDQADPGLVPQPGHPGHRSAETDLRRLRYRRQRDRNRRPGTAPAGRTVRPATRIICPVRAIPPAHLVRAVRRPVPLPRPEQV